MTVRTLRRLLPVAAVATMLGFVAAPAHALDQAVLAIDPLITMDPAIARGTAQDLSILSQLYSSLTTINEDGDLVGDLAIEWSNTGAREFTFKLHEGITFADGEPLDANTIVWNFARLDDPATNARSNTDFDLIESVTAVDSTTLVIKTKEPWIELPRRLSWTYFIAPEWSKTHDPRIEVNPSGPYLLVDYDLAAFVRLKRNDNYYGRMPAVENVTYRVIGNAATRISALRSGELDASLRIDAVDMEQLSSLPNYDVGAIEGRRVHILRFNLNTEALQDLRVRQAINYAVNKELITRTIYRGLTTPAPGQVLSPLNEGFNAGLSAYPYDPEMARQLLAEAGYADGLTLRLGVTGEAGHIQAVPAAQAIAAQLADVGITLNIETVPGASFATYLRDEPNAPDLVYNGYVSQANSSTELLSQFNSAAAYSWGDSPAAYDEAVAAAKAALAEEEQISHIETATQVAFDEALVVFLWAQPQTYAVSDKLSWKVRTDDWIRASDIYPAQ